MTFKRHKRNSTYHRTEFEFDALAPVELIHELTEALLGQAGTRVTAYAVRLVADSDSDAVEFAGTAVVTSDRLIYGYGERVVISPLLRTGAAGALPHEPWNTSVQSWPLSDATFTEEDGARYLRAPGGFYEMHKIRERIRCLPGI